MWRPCPCIACTERTSFLCNIFSLNQNVMWINIDWLSSDVRQTEGEIQMDYMATCSPDARCHESSRPFHLPSPHLPWNPGMASGMVCCSHINADSVLSAKVCCLSLCVFVCMSLNLHCICAQCITHTGADRILQVYPNSCRWGFIFSNMCRVIAVTWGVSKIHIEVHAKTFRSLISCACMIPCTFSLYLQNDIGWPFIWPEFNKSIIQNLKKCQNHIS